MLTEQDSTVDFGVRVTEPVEPVHSNNYIRLHCGVSTRVVVAVSANEDFAGDNRTDDFELLLKEGKRQYQMRLNRSAANVGMVVVVSSPRRC